MPTSATRTRLGALALAIAAVMFILYPATRPWTDEATVDGAVAAMSSSSWVASHFFAMIGFILVPLGLLALHAVVSDTRAEPVAFAAVVTSWIGAGLTLPYYGAEDFGLNAIANRFADGEKFNLLSVVEGFRYGTLAVIMFAAGLLLLGVGAVLAAVAIWRSGLLPRYSGVPFALGFGLFIPQFFTGPELRIGHGVLLAIGLAWLAVDVWRARPGRS